MIYILFAWFLTTYPSSFTDWYEKYDRYNSLLTCMSRTEGISLEQIPINGKLKIIIDPSLNQRDRSLACSKCAIWLENVPYQCLNNPMS